MSTNIGESEIVSKLTQEERDAGFFDPDEWNAKVDARMKKEVPLLHMLWHMGLVSIDYDMTPKDKKKSDENFHKIMEKLRKLHVNK